MTSSVYTDRVNPCHHPDMEPLNKWERWFFIATEIASKVLLILALLYAMMFVILTGDLPPW